MGRPWPVLDPSSNAYRKLKPHQGDNVQRRTVCKPPSHPSCKLRLPLYLVLKCPFVWLPFSGQDLEHSWQTDNGGMPLTPPLKPWCILMLGNTNLYISPTKPSPSSAVLMVCSLSPKKDFSLCNPSDSLQVLSTRDALTTAKMLPSSPFPAKKNVLYPSSPLFLAPITQRSWTVLVLSFGKWNGEECVSLMLLE